MYVYQSWFREISIPVWAVIVGRPSPSVIQLLIITAYLCLMSPHHPILDISNFFVVNLTSVQL